MWVLYKHTHTYIYTHIQTYARAHIYTHTHIYLNMHIYTYIYIHTQIYINIHLYTRLQTNMHVFNIHVNTRFTFTRTHIQHTPIHRRYLLQVLIMFISPMNNLKVTNSQNPGQYHIIIIYFFFHLFSDNSPN